MIRKARAVWRGSGRTRFENHKGTELNTEAIVTLEQDNEAFRISRSGLTLRASVPNLDQDTFDRMAQDAEQNCPVSRVLRAEITLDAKLV
jgi:lipoyl-dependent peroxiredoxin